MVSVEEALKESKKACDIVRKDAKFKN